MKIVFAGWQPRLSLFALVLFGTLSGCSSKSGIEASPLSLGAAPPGARMRAGYVSLINHDARDRTLTHAMSTAYELVEFHITIIDDGVARMREETNLTLAANSELHFERNGRHLMLMMPTAAADKQPIVIELCFADGECIAVSSAAQGSDD